MASTSALQRLVSTALLLSIGAFRGALMMISVALQVLLKGKCVLEPKERREEPECLRDPALGSHEFVTLEDVTLHYVSAGSRDKPLVLLLHGFPDFWFSWKCQILDLKKDFWVVAPDLRGYGQSSKPANVDDYQTFKLIEDVHGLVKSLGRSKVTIVGHDWGAVIAWCFATKHEDMVEKLIIVNGPHPMAMQHQLHNSLDQIVKSWYFVAFQAPSVPEAFFRANDMRALDKVHAVYSDEEREAFKYTFGKPGALTSPINYYRASFRRHSAGGLQFRRLAIPALVVWGKRDFALTEELAALSLDYAMGGRVEYVSDAGHWVQRERPEVVNGHIRHFLL